MRRYDVIAELCDAMLALGWKPYQNDHEDANGQFEMNWEYDDALVTADRHVFFKFMVKSIAEKHGLRATFMPKPFPQLTGSGCHAHMSRSGRASATCSPTMRANSVCRSVGYQFIGGIMHHAQALCALLNPVVNSYKRINAQRTLSGATWSPNAVSYSGDNRTHMIRIPDAGRFELRLADGAVNPYLLQAAILAAGLDGMAAARDPGRRLDINMYTDGPHGRAICRGCRSTCSTRCGRWKRRRRSPMRSARTSRTPMSSCGGPSGTSIRRHLTQWERDTTLDI